ncbi:uncharacterized, partial [Tachysurus ichikawai]
FASIFSTKDENRRDVEHAGFKTFLNEILPTGLYNVEPRINRKVTDLRHELVRGAETLGPRINLPQIMFDKFKALNKAQCPCSWTSELRFCIGFSSVVSDAELADAAENSGALQTSCSFFVKRTFKTLLNIIRFCAVACALILRGNA